MTLLEQLEEWHQNDEYQKIIEELEKIPASERSNELTGLLARAYENAACGAEHPEYHLHAIELLQSAVEEDDANWNFRMGFALYWLDREEEAIPYFERIFTLIDSDPETQAFWADARELLDYCRTQAARKRQSKADEPYLTMSRRIW